MLSGVKGQPTPTHLTRIFYEKYLQKRVCLNSSDCEACRGNLLKLLWSSLLTDKANKAFPYAWMAAHQAQQTTPSAKVYQNVKN